MLMVPMPPALMEHREDWNRADSTSLGSDWRLEFNTMKIATNRVQFKTPANGDGRAGAWATFLGASSGYYNGGRLLTDNWAIEAQLAAPVGSAATDNTTTIGCCMGDASINGTTAVYMLMTTGSGHNIFTYGGVSAVASPGASTGQAGQTNRQGTTGAISTTSLIRIERRMYSATQSVITAFINGSATINWNDSGGVLPSGDRTKRRWFIQNEGNFPIFQQAFYSPGIDWVRAYDLKA